MKTSIVIALATSLLVAAPALAGGNGTVHKRTVLEGTTCTADAGCKELTKLPQVTSAKCIKTGKYKGKCYIQWDECLQVDPNWIGTWNPALGFCEFQPKIPDDALCFSDEDCGAGGGVSQFGNVLVSEGAVCDILNPAPFKFGVCAAIAVGATCCAWGMNEDGSCLPQPKYCFSNADCYADGMTCQDHICKLATFSQQLGDGNVCQFQSECASSPWGQVCVWTQSNSSTGALCQECTQKDEDNNGIDDGCSPERPVCHWGISWPDPVTAEYRSYYQCEAVDM